MWAVIVYESLHGNTRQVAEAIAAGIRAADPAAKVSCGTADRVGAEVTVADLLVVGAPTHVFGLPGPRSRRLWVRGVARAGADAGQGVTLEAGAGGPGVLEWLEGLASVDGTRLAAAFDTRLRGRLSGGAATRIARRLRHTGYRLVAEPTGFHVADMTGPLEAGELERARAFGASLVRQRVA